MCWVPVVPTWFGDWFLLFWPDFRFFNFSGVVGIGAVEAPGPTLFPVLPPLSPPDCAASTTPPIPVVVGELLEFAFEFGLPRWLPLPVFRNNELLFCCSFRFAKYSFLAVSIFFFKYLLLNYNVYICSVWLWSEKLFRTQNCERKPFYRNVILNSFCHINIVVTFIRIIKQLEKKHNSLPRLVFLKTFTSFLVCYFYDLIFNAQQHITSEIRKINSYIINHDVKFIYRKLQQKITKKQELFFRNSLNIYIIKHNYSCEKNSQNSKSVIVIILTKKKSYPCVWSD